MLHEEARQAGTQSDKMSPAGERVLVVSWRADGSLLCPVYCAVLLWRRYQIYGHGGSRSEKVCLGMELILLGRQVAYHAYLTVLMLITAVEGVLF